MVLSKMEIVLYTAIHCPKCPPFRHLLREVAAELGLHEGVDFVEKLLDGVNLPVGGVTELDGDAYHIVRSADAIRETPAAIGGQDFTIEALSYQVASTPALIIGGELAFLGDVPSKEELTTRLKEEA